MAVSRRKFIKKGSLVALAAGVPLQALSSVSAKESTSLASSLLSERHASAISRFTRADFARHLNTTFRFRRQNSRAIVFKLVEVVEFAGTKGTSARNGECFSAMFSGPGDSPLEQNTYKVDHGDMGSFDLFVVPVGRAKGEIRYEAVFNHRCA